MEEAAGCMTCEKRDDKNQRKNAPQSYNKHNIIVGDIFF